MAVGKSGYLPSYYLYNAYYESTYGGMYIKPHWVEEYDVAGNYSIIKIDYIEFTSSMYSQSVSWEMNGTISINGVAYSYSGDVTTASYTATKWPCSIVSDPIYHNADGTKSITIALVHSWCASGQVGARWEDSGTLSTSTVTLTSIPRASTISATDANIEAVSSIAVNRKSSAYTHSIQYQFGSLSGYINADGSVSSSEVKFSATSIGFTIPSSFYAQIPNSKTGICTLTIRTYSGSTQIGDAKTCTFTVTAAQSNCAPSVSGTVVDVNETTLALTGDENKLVRFFSNALATITATAKNAASIASKVIAGVEVSEDTRTINAVETASFAFAATDSRGYSGYATVTKTLIEYIKLTCNMTVTRDDPTSGKATLIVKGDYFNGSFGAVDNSLTVQFRIADGDWISITPTIDGNTYIAVAALTDLDYQSTFEFEVQVTDKLMTVTKSEVLNKGIPNCHMGEDNVAFEVPVYFGEKSVTARSLLTRGTSNGDFNERVDHGVYWMQLASCTNGPATDGFGFLEVINCFGDPYSGILQRFTFYNTKRSLVRSYVNSEWTSWSDPSYPVGAIYISAVSTSPASLFGGTWTRITARFLYAVSDGYAGTTGGSETNTHKHYQTVGYDGSNIYAVIGVNHTNSKVETFDKRGYAALTAGTNTSSRLDATYNETISIMPPYYGVYVWRRTA